VDRLGLLKVGPDSAGSSPGPACYGRGGAEPTVTDAELRLGDLDPDSFLGGRMRLDRDAAAAAIAPLAEHLGLSLIETAWGIHRVVNEQMAGAARVHAIEGGRDLRAFPLFAFGGAGPVHAYRVAEILRSPEILLPVAAGIASATGFLLAPLSFDLSRSAPGRLAALDWPAANARLTEMEEEGRATLSPAGVDPAAITVRRSVDLRYAGQGHDVRVAIPDGPLSAESAEVLDAAFAAVYRRLYGRTAPGNPIEATTWHVTVAARQPDLPLGGLMARSGTRPPSSASRARPVYLSETGGFVPVPVYERAALRPGVAFVGPAIVEEPESTAVIGPDAQAAVDDLGNLVVRMPLRS
jgi:N-methylhydantoinase A/oxoprolinase/acetone carboxylase beta subunit